MASRIADRKMGEVQQRLERSLRRAGVTRMRPEATTQSRRAEGLGAGCYSRHPLTTSKNRPKNIPRRWRQWRLRRITKDKVCEKNHVVVTRPIRLVRCCACFPNRRGEWLSPFFVPLGHSTLELCRSPLLASQTQGRLAVDFLACFLSLCGRTLLGDLDELTRRSHRLKNATQAVACCMRLYRRENYGRN
ncbi:hypothetical protein K474DRAFT_203536 [Panus rudis PR-1116 ss-1]|nr:hypothetical protein K474DRAFT_203536 [Panus rudis PR-1116 ss-1]